MINKGKCGLLATMLMTMMMSPQPLSAAEFSASFKGADIQEFINTVGKNLNKTIIVEPSVRGTINVRSYDLLNEEQYYQFFLSVLDVYGFAVVPMDNGVLKVVRAKDAKTSAIPVVDDRLPGIGDEMVTRVVPVRNVSVRELAPLLRQLNDNAGGGNVVHYEPSNVLLITGRAAVVSRLVEIVRRVDKVGDQDVDLVKLKYASAAEMVRLLTALTREESKANLSSALAPKVVADERTNAVIVSGEPQGRQRIVRLIRQLDQDQAVQGNTRVFYLKYAKAKNLVEVLTGVSKSVEAGKQGATKAAAPSAADKLLSIEADEQTNSLVITAQPDTMQALEQVIARLDIRRAQVLVEAIIVEVQEGNGLNFGVQWANITGSGTQFTNTGLPSTTVAAGVNEFNQDGILNSSFSSALGSFNGLATGFFDGNWGALLTALANSSQSNILATPSIVTLDNKEASINIGQEVPVLSGSQTTSGDNVFNTVDRKTVGTKLTVTPQINEGDSVLLEIQQEVSSVADAASSSSTELGATFNTRTVQNAVLVKSGETVVLGGLLDDATQETVYKVPLLGDIPLLGYLFRSNSTQKTKRNLMVFIRPTILRDPVTYSGISNTKYNLFRAQQLDALENNRDRLLPQPGRPVLPAYGQAPLLSPALQKEMGSDASQEPVTEVP